MFDNIYEGKRVFVTGHTGFKGSWLSQWLLDLGAKVCGFSVDIPSHPANFEILGLADRMQHILGDVRDRDQLMRAMRAFQPEIVFHLAAQPLVRRSFDDPITTFETNTLGTLNVLECIRQVPSVQVGVFITSDKAYRNVEWTWGYRENDMLGGEDPYSASKGCAELIIYSYMHSYFKNGPRIASTRAGNVIGGGDWAADRIVPDAVRAWSKGEVLSIRSPKATRPWQHVLEPLGGYLWLGAKLWEEDAKAVGEAFNFGPDAKVNQPVEDLLTTMTQHWPGSAWRIDKDADTSKKESTLLKLSCDKALSKLDWRAILSFEETVAMTADWYRTFYAQGDQSQMVALTRTQIEAYRHKADGDGLLWAVQS